MERLRNSGVDSNNECLVSTIISEDTEMRPLFAIALVLCAITTLRAQDVPPRFDVIYNAEFYRQDSPQEALKSVLGAISRDRYDYVLAHLMDPAYVDARLASTRTYFDRVAAEQIGATNAGKAMNAADFQGRTREMATRLNIKQLAEQFRQKLADRARQSDSAIRSEAQLGGRRHGHRFDQGNQRQNGILQKGR